VHNENLKTITEEEETQERFHANLATGLHALAQPLTVLRSAVVASSLSGLSDEDRKRYSDISAEQVERACSFFQSLQQMLALCQNQPERARIDVAAMLAPVVEGQKETFAAAGLGINVLIPYELPAAAGDMDRTLQALFAVLKIAVAISQPGGVTELRVNHWRGFVVLSVRNAVAHGRRLNAAERLSLALAETNLRSQHGKYEFAEDPFHVSLALPVLTLETAKSQDASHSLRAQSFH
jgi:signal transduction histidine kinase